MTIEELLECSAEKLKSFTREQLHEWFAKYIPTTRPDLVVKKEATSSVQKHSKQKHLAEQFEMQQLYKKVEELAKSKGIDLKMPTKSK